jgi:hypothetical protein
VVAEAAKGRVAFVTGNTGDFCNQEETGLAEELLLELNGHQLPRNQVAWYRDLKSFAEAVIPPADRAVEEVRDLLASDPDFGHTMLALISDAAENFSLVNEWEMGPNPSGALDLPTDSSEPTLVFFEVKRVDACRRLIRGKDGGLGQCSGALLDAGVGSCAYAELRGSPRFQVD